MDPVKNILGNKIEFDSFNGNFYLGETRLSIKRALTLSKTGRYYFEEYGQRGGTSYSSGVVEPQYAYAKVKEWSKVAR